MSKPKFTPGPWHLDEAEWPIRIMKKDYSDPHNDRVFPIADPLACPAVYEGTREERCELARIEALGNARLMACAPEMYLALKKYVAFMATDSADWGEHFLEVSNLVDRAEGVSE